MYNLLRLTLLIIMTGISLDWLAKEWHTLRSAPVTFGTVLLACVFATWKIAEKWNEKVINDKKSQLETLEKTLNWEKEKSKEQEVSLSKKEQNSTVEKDDYQKRTNFLALRTEYAKLSDEELAQKAEEVIKRISAYAVEQSKKLPEPDIFAIPSQALPGAPRTPGNIAYEKRQTIYDATHSGYRKRFQEDAVLLRETLIARLSEKHKINFYILPEYIRSNEAGEIQVIKNIQIYENACRPQDLETISEELKRLIKRL